MITQYMRRFCLLTVLPWSLHSLDSPMIAPKPTNSFTQEEVNALKEWVQAKKQVVGIKSLGGELTFSGEVHAGMSYTNEVVNNIRQRGHGGAVPAVGSREFLVEMDLLMNYRTDITWATAKVKFKNRAGSASGTADKVSLDRAFLGVRFLEGETYTMALEAGRRKLNYTFDSIIQFSAFMDGLLYKYDQSIETVGDLYFYGGPFVVDFTEDHYAYVFELGVLNIGNTGLYTKYSFIDWDTKSYSNHLKDDAFRFINSQLTLGYKIVPKWLGKVLTVYGAGLVNSAAKPLAITDYKKANYAWYIVWAMGEARKQGDWSLQVDYQYVMPQAVPTYDCAGIGRGNAAGVGFYSVDNKYTTPTTRATAAGNTNYKGFEVIFLYLFTNNLTLRQSYQMSIRQDKQVGPIFRFKQYGMELVYLF
ncbi:MAG: hypothetical protein FJZ63_06560 [Chlamydiae bacterium]|nr:hypothetical protein [Chlamydiota bacterium]